MLQSRLQLLLLASAVVTLTACGGEEAESPAVSADPVEASAPVEQTASVESTSPDASDRTAVIAEFTPSDRIRGTASLGGTRTVGGQQMAIVSDADAAAQSTYVPITTQLEAGRYTFSADYDLSCAGAPSCQTVVRVRPPASAETFRIVNAFAGSDGQAGTATGSFDKFSVTPGSPSKIELEFTVPDDSVGAYRIFMIPAAAVDGKYDNGLTGDLAVAGISLSKNG